MGKGGRTKDELQTGQAQDEPSQSSSAEKEARFMAALQRMMGDTELTVENIRVAMQSLTPEQRQELLSESAEFKQDLLTKKEHTEERNLFRKEFNQETEKAGMPIDKDGMFLAKKVTTFMSTSNEQIPMLVLLEAIASCPFLVKAAIAEARGDATATCASATDLEEIEAALSVLKVPGWRDGETEGRPPFVRRNLLLLHAHMYKERLNALSLSEATLKASSEVIIKARRLSDMVFSYSMQCGWVKAVLALTELQACLVNGLWDHADDECRMSMKQKLSAVGLKMPKIGVRCQATDVGPGEKVTVNVTVTRSHAHSGSEMAEYRKWQQDEAAQQQQVERQLAEAGGADITDAPGTGAGEGGPTEEETTEGWWLVVESIRALPGLQKAGIEQAELAHNSLAGAPTPLLPSLADRECTASVSFNAPTTPGEYKVIVHVRSSGMIGVDAKRKVAFLVQGSKTKRSNVSSSSGGSAELGDTEESMEETTSEGAEIGEGEIDYAAELRKFLMGGLHSVTAKMEKDPFKAMQQVLFQASLEEKPTPLTDVTPSSPEVDAYKVKYGLDNTVEDCLFKMKKRLVVGPEEGFKFLLSDAGDYFTEWSKTLKARGGDLGLSLTAEELKAKDAADAKAKREKEAKAEAERDAADAENAKRAAALEASGKKATGGLHKFDASEVDAYGGDATADDFLDAFGF